MLELFAFNFDAIVLLVGLLDWYLQIHRGQSMQLRFDIRPVEKHSRFTFGYQDWDNMFWSLASGVSVWTAWLVIYFYITANG